MHASRFGGSALGVFPAIGLFVRREAASGPADYRLSPLFVLSLFENLLFIAIFHIKGSDPFSPCFSPFPWTPYST